VESLVLFGAAMQYAVAVNRPLSGLRQLTVILCILFMANKFEFEFENHSPCMRDFLFTCKPMPENPSQKMPYFQTDGHRKFSN